jgi:hypothetical protein
MATVISWLKAYLISLYRQFSPQPDGEGLLRHLAGDRFDVFSAGTGPSVLHPLATAVMHDR